MIVPDKPVIICLAGMDRVTALLAAWNDWRRHGSYDPVQRGPESWLGKMIKVMRRATGEDKLTPQTMPVYDDDLMLQVTRVIQQMPEVTRQCVMEHYCYAPWWPVWDAKNPRRCKAGRCGVSERTYYRRVAEGRAFLDWCIPWHQMTVVYPEERYRRLREGLEAASQAVDIP